MCETLFVVQEEWQPVGAMHGRGTGCQQTVLKDACMTDTVIALVGLTTQGFAGAI